MKKLMITLTIAGAMLAASTANAAVFRVGVGPVRVGVRRAPIRRVHVAPRPIIRPVVRPVIRPVARPVIAPPVVVPARPAVRAAVIHHRRDLLWDAVEDALQQ